MARVNVYVPDDLADEARASGLNVSQLTQRALREALSARRTDEWLDAVVRLRPTGVAHRRAVAAVEAAKDEFEHGG
ncbi:MAG: type II toxin-antitoxin system CcdA family antitoxin [Acidimicrobiia bacterium]